MKINEFLDKIAEILQKDWPHLRHSLRGGIEIDDKLKQDIIEILEED